MPLPPPANSTAFISAIVKPKCRPGIHFAPKRPEGIGMIRKLKTGEYRLYSRKLNPKTGRCRNLGTFGTREAAVKHERAVQFFKRQG